MKKGYRVLLVFAMALLFTVVCKTGVQAASDVTLKNGKWVSGKLTSASAADQYYRINVKKTGYIKVEYKRSKEDASNNVVLCNAAKKEIVEAYNKGYIGVKKGTYYIHINDRADTDVDEENDNYDDEIVTESYKLRYSFTAMKHITKTNGTMKKAPLLKSGKEVSGVILSTNKQRGYVYYKVKVPAKQKVNFEYELGSARGLITLRIANAKGKLLEFKKDGTVSKSKKDNFTYWYDKSNDFVVLEPGTYYFEISVGLGDPGYYKLKLK